MTDQLIRVDLADGSSWYFSSATTAKERTDLVLSHVYDTLGSIRQRSDDGQHPPNDRRHELLQTLTPEIDFAIGLLAGAP
ncbi:hypothetical protein [Vreelandella rituensis]|nr:hypothetical protein [Halomonas rituensis]